MISVALVPLFIAVLASATSSVVLPTNSFSSYSAFEQHWNYLYPWGSDHNGSGRMVGSSSNHTYISVADNVLTLTSKPVSGQPPSTSNPHPAIHYFSGTVHAKQQVKVDGSSVTGFDIQGEFIAPTAKGTWPAFWLTAVNGWPPESDIGEWKTGSIPSKVRSTSSSVATKRVAWPTDGQFHSLKAELRTISGNTKDLSIKYYFDGTLQATHTAANFRNAAMWLIVDLQMEGSSGSPGPAGGTTFQIRNVQLTKYTP
ncbi:putative glycoside hydrolase [Auricularia subglabra TFB-10046 SS5]|nr:putative glycoside hydrolase [Auricularia subglabra TFB-10046 SS5]